MNKLHTATIGLLALATTACSSVSAEPTSTAPAGTNRAVSSAPVEPATTISASTDSAAEVETSAPAQDGVATFGEAFTWEDGLSLTVGKAAPYKPSESAATGGEFTKFVVVEVRVVNKTGKAWDPSLMSITAQSADEEAERVFDSEKLPDEPTTKLLNGREAKFKAAFGVANPKDLVIEFHPDFEHDSVLFQS